MRWITVLWLLIFIVPAVSQAAPIQVTDIVGRSITLMQPAQRFVISEGRYVLTLGILRPDNPVKGLVGMMQPISWTYPELQKQVYARHPEARDIALFGRQDASSVSVEQIIDLKPQVAIFGVQDHGPGSKNAELLAQLEKANIKVVFIDFRMQPLQNTVPSIRILGNVLGASEKAERFIADYEKRARHIEKVLQKKRVKPRVFLQAHPGRFHCCVAMADGMLGPFVERAGGLNIADAVAPGPTSQHTVEFLLVQNPDVWIGTASGTLADFQTDKNILALGPEIDQAKAEKSLRRYLIEPEFQALDAVRNGRAHAIWHDFYNSPLNIVVLEAFAKWIHPDLFVDSDPEKIMLEIYQQYLPFTWSGTATATMNPLNE
jgi:iron complex transport system substrate-binding protein